jgi:hypothetical protein
MVLTEYFSIFHQVYFFIDKHEWQATDGFKANQRKQKDKQLNSPYTLSFG